MVSRQYHCQNQRRRMALYRLKDENGQPLLNGIDYLEVSADRQSLLVYCIHPVTNTNPETENFQIESVDGLGEENISVESVNVDENLIVLGILSPSDLSIYKLQIIEADAKSLQPWQGFDPQLFQIEFSFGVSEVSEFDCESLPPSPDLPPLPPTIDYLAKDYGSFRQLMLDRLAVTMPQWKERSPADLGVMLVELVAYTADYLSYYQDAVATEAYLGTARKRVSMRRHARLLNYPMHDGCTSRAWVVLQVEKPMKLRGPIAPGTKLPPTTESVDEEVELQGTGYKEDKIMPPNATLYERENQPYPGTRFLTKRPNLPNGVLNDKQFKAAVNEGAVVFETMYDVELNPAKNEIHFYTWGDGDCYLAKGATQATLKNPNGELKSWLQEGSILIFEEIGINTENVRLDANPAHRHPVLLTKVIKGKDLLFNQQIIEIEWAAVDRLPFDLIISKTIGDREIPYSVARGNVVLIDRGRTVNYPFDADEYQNLDPNTNNRLVRLAYGPITQQAKIRDPSGKLVLDLKQNSQAAAANAMKWELAKVMPAIALAETDTERQKTHYWYPQRDLLNSDRFSREFVVETEDDGRPYLRFGDGNLGRKPKTGIQLTPIYRVGNGSSGNVGAESIAHIYDDRGLEELFLKGNNPIRNPLPAQGGIDPESIEEVKLYAPQAFSTLQRAVTEADYAEIVQRFPGVSKALATRRWTGSWYTIFITVDRLDGLPVDEDFKTKLRQFLEPFRLTGQDLEIEEPRFVPLDLSLTVQVKTSYFRSEVKAALILEFSNRVLNERQLGFFHPDNFSFGQPVYLSQVIARAMQVAGVQSVVVDRFQRWELPDRGELATGSISLGRLEIALLDNNANRAGRGKIEFSLEGGL